MQSFTVFASAYSPNHPCYVDAWGGLSRPSPAVSTQRLSPTADGPGYDRFSNQSVVVELDDTEHQWPAKPRMIGYELLKTGTLVSFRVLKEEVLSSPADEAEFGLRLELKFVPDGDDEEQDEDEVAEDTAEWAFGFIFALGLLSFAEAKPRNASLLEYEEKAEFKFADFIEGLRFVRGALHFDADYGRRAPGQDSHRRTPKWPRHAGNDRSRQGGAARRGCLRWIRSDVPDAVRRQSTSAFAALA